METLRRDSNAAATVMDGHGRCDGYVTATTAMKHSGDSGGAPTSNGHHRGMLAHYGQTSVHLKLLSFGYKYGAAPHRSRDGFTYACPLPTLDVCDLDRVPGHVSKFNGLSHLVRRSLLNPPGGRVKDNRRRNCDGNCDHNDIYGNDGGGGRQRQREKRTVRDAVQ